MGVFIECVASEEILAGLVDEGDMHVAAVSRKSLLRLRHETRRDTILCANTLDNVLEQRSPISHLRDLSKLEGILEHAGARLCVPALNVARELGARVEDVVVVLLVVNGAG